MSNSTSQSGHTLEFIEPRVRFWMRIGTMAIIVVLVLLSLGIQPKPRTEIGTGPVNRSGQKEVYSIKRPPVESVPEPATTQPEPENSADPNQGKDQVDTTDINPINETKLNHAEPVESKPSNQASADNSFSNEDPGQNDKSVETQSSTNNQAQFDRFEIIAGETAPAYELASADLYDYLTQQNGCRYIITDGKLSVELGRSIQSNSLRTIGAEWNDLYSKRKVRIPMSGVIRNAVNAAAQRYKLQSDARCYLCVPHQLDRAIYSAQKAYLGEEDWDVNVTTEVDFVDGRPVVTRVIDHQGD